MLVDHSLKTKKEYKHLGKKETHDLVFQHDVAHGDFNNLPNSFL